MKMILADVSASDAWVSSCPFQDLSFINCYLMACDSQNGFPRGSSGDTHEERERRGGTSRLCLLHQGSSSLSCVLGLPHVEMESRVRESLVICKKGALVHRTPGHLTSNGDCNISRELPALIHCTPAPQQLSAQPNIYETVQH